MALINMNIFSEELGTQTGVNVIIPQKSTKGQIGIDNKVSDGKFKCLYLLHGLSDDETIWMRRTSIERYASQYGICIVMPNGARSFYTDMKYGMNYYSYIAKELPKIITEMFNVSTKREDNYIGGLSMGGYGALKIGLRECDSFCSVAALSPVIDPNLRNYWNADLNAIFGENGDTPDEDNLFHLIKEKNDNPNKPKIFIGIGKNDFLYDYSQKFREEISKLDYDFTYKESEGVHCWEFWDEYIQYALKWMFESK